MDLPIILTKEERKLIAEQLDALKDKHKKDAAHHEHHANWKPKTDKFHAKHKKKLIHHKHCIINIDTLLNKLGVA